MERNFSEDKVVLIHDSFFDFLNSHKDTIFRYWVYRRLFTPYEIDKKFIDENVYEDSYCTHAKIVEVITLPNGDLLLGFLLVNPDERFMREEEKSKIKNIQFCKLSEIRLEICNVDNEIDEDEDEDEDWEDE